MKLTLPEPPSVNHYWRVVRGRPIISRDGRQWKERALTAAIIARLRPLDGSVAVSFTWYRGRRSGDLDNRTKVILDVLNGLAYHDDRQVVEIHAFRREDKQHPRVEITITEAA